MQNQHLFPHQSTFVSRVSSEAPSEVIETIARVPRQAAIGMLLVAALLAFEVFNFDTTRFALANLLGDVNFGGLRWASILALAFCSIDFAGLAHLFGPARDAENNGETWYLMGAWFLGATMNALMTWWAVNLTLLNHGLGNEILSREQLLDIVPTFVAVLVWLTRILFIGAFSVAGDHFFQPRTVEEEDADAQELPFGPEERDFSIHSIPPRRPLRDLDQSIPQRTAGGFRPIPRAPREASLGLSVRSRHSD